MLYDGLVKSLNSNESHLIESVIDIDTINCITESSNFICLESKFAIPQEYKLTEEDINGDLSKLKSKYDKIIKYMEDNLEDKPNKFLGKSKSTTISDSVYGLYYSILGCTFSDPNLRYKPKMSWYVGMINKYCEDKKRSKIKKDMESTINSLTKMENNGKQLNQLQKDWLKDISENVNKIK